MRISPPSWSTQISGVLCAPRRSCAVSAFVCCGPITLSRNRITPAALPSRRMSRTYAGAEVPAKRSTTRRPDLARERQLVDGRRSRRRQRSPENRRAPSPDRLARSRQRAGRPRRGERAPSACGTPTARERGRRRVQHPRPRPVRPTARRSRSASGARSPAAPAHARSGSPDSVPSSAKTSTDAPIAAVVPRSRASPRAAAGARAAATFAASEETSIGPIKLRAATRVLLRSALSVVLVGPDRDVLGAVVLGEAGPAERERRRQQAHGSGRELLSTGGESRSAQCARDHRRRDDRAENRRAGERKAGLRKRSVHDGKKGEGFRQPQAGRAVPVRRRTRQSAASSPTRRAGHRPRRAPPLPTRSDRAREHRSAAPSRRAERFPSPSLRG